MTHETDGNGIRFDMPGCRPIHTSIFYSASSHRHTHSPGLPRQKNSWTDCRRGNFEKITAALRGPCRSGRERLSHRIPVNARAPELVAARRAVLDASGYPTAVSSGSTGCGMASAGSDRLMLKVLLWLVGRYSEQGVMLHVCSKAFQCRPFRMTWLEVGARRALGAVGGARRDSATMCYSGPVLAGPEGCSRGRWRSGPSKWRHTAAPEGRGQGAPRTCRCIETIQHEPEARRQCRQGAPRTCRCIET